MPRAKTIKRDACKGLAPRLRAFVLAYVGEAGLCAWRAAELSGHKGDNRTPCAIGTFLLGVLDRRAESKLVGEPRYEKLTAPEEEYASPHLMAAGSSSRRGIRCRITSAPHKRLKSGSTRIRRGAPSTTRPTTTGGNRAAHQGWLQPHAWAIRMAPASFINSG